MRLSDAFPGNYLKAADLNGAEPVVTIDRVVMEAVGEKKEQKPVIYFIGKDKGMVLNKTNALAIEDFTGEEDTDNWPGHRLKLVTAKVTFQGKMVSAIRVEAAPKAKPAAKAKAKPAPEPEPEPEEYDAPADDDLSDIPF